MPSTSPKMKRTMAACSHGSDLEVCNHIPMRVAQEFNRADTGKPPLTSPGGLTQRGSYMKHG